MLGFFCGRYETNPSVYFTMRIIPENRPVTGCGRGVLACYAPVLLLLVVCGRCVCLELQSLAIIYSCARDTSGWATANILDWPRAPVLIGEG